ncbi:MAG: hypothetical protein P8P48_11890 [Saprospiraceae bacterium]|nr:hypothetical protein [Saprospiraceae bacterium]
MISEEEMTDYLSGKMKKEKQKEFINQVQTSQFDLNRFNELKAIRDGISFHHMINLVEADLREQGFFNSSQAKIKRFNFTKVFSIAAGVLFLIFALVVSYSTSNYSNKYLANEGLILLDESFPLVGLISKGELPAIEYSGRQQDPIIESVLYALNNKDYALVLKQIQLGREKNDILDVDRMHLDWMEIQVMLILERPETEVRKLITTIANNKQHYYNIQARDLLKKHSSFWRSFAI